MEDEARTVRDCLRGDAAAWEALLDLHGPYLRRLVVKRMSGSGGDPDAVFQDLWIRLWEDGGRRLRAWDGARPLRPYLAAAALNLCRDRLGRRPGVPLPEAEDPAPGPAERAQRREEAERAKAALGTLTPRERAAFALVELEGLGYAEAGRILGLAEGSVGSLLTRARERLKSDMGRKEPLRPPVSPS